MFYTCPKDVPLMLCHSSLALPNFSGIILKAMEQNGSPHMFYL